MEIRPVYYSVEDEKFKPVFRKFPELMRSLPQFALTFVQIDKNLASCLTLANAMLHTDGAARDHVFTQLGAEMGNLKFSYRMLTTREEGRDWMPEYMRIYHEYVTSAIKAFQEVMDEYVEEKQA